MSRITLIFIFIISLHPSVASAATFKIATLSPEGSPWMDIMRSGADEVAETLGTINYEVVSALTSRVPRRFRKAGEPER